VALAAGADEEDLGFDGALLALGVLQPHGDAVLADVDVVGGGAGADSEVHLLPLEGAGELVGDLLVFHRDDVADEGDFRAVALVDRTPFDAGGAAAADDEALRQVVEEDGVVGVDDARRVPVDALDRAGAGTGVDDDVLRLEAEGGAAVVRGDADGGGGQQAAATHEDRDLVLLLEEVEETLVLAVDDLQRALEGGVVVETDVAADLAAEFLGLLDLIEAVGRLEESLGRDAASVEAGAAEFDLFDDGDVETELLGADGGDVAAGAAAEDDEIELVSRCAELGHWWWYSPRVGRTTTGCRGGRGGFPCPARPGQAALLP